MVLTKKMYILLIFYVFSISFLLMAIYYMDDIKILQKHNEEFVNRSIILLDVSQSMNIRDMPWNRSRLDLAKKYISNYREQTQNLVGLTIFAWEWVNILPINSDKNYFIDVLRGINYSHVRLQWSRLDSGIMQTYNLFGVEDGWNLIIFTDQDSYEWIRYQENIEHIGKLLKNKNIDVTLIWVGTESWWKIEVWRDMFWDPIYKKYRWQIVTAPLEREYLQNVASKLWGRYIEIENISFIFDNDNFWKWWTLSIRIVYIYSLLSLIFFILCLSVIFWYPRKFLHIIS